MKAVKFSVAAAAALALSTAALANPTVYGQINGEFVMDDDGVDTHMVAKSYGSRLGVKGSQDLGDGLTGLYQVEMAIDPTVGVDSNDGRNSFVGMSGGFGTVLIGNHDTPYKIASRATGMVAHSDATDTLTFNERRLRKAVAYIAPIEGMTVAAAVVPFGQESEMHMSLGVVVPVSDELTIGLGYESANGNAVGIDETATYMYAGAKYKMGAMSIGLGVEMGNEADVTALVVDAITAGDITEAEAEAAAKAANLKEFDDYMAIMIPFNMNMDGGMFVNAALKMTSYDAAGADDKMEVGASIGKNFGKAAEAYVAMKMVDAGGTSDATTDMAVGMRVKF